MPVLSAAVPHIGRPPSFSGLPPSSRGSPAAGRAGARVPAGGPAVQDLWQANASGAAGGGAAPTVRPPADRGGGLAIRAVPVEPAGSAAAPAGPVGGPAVARRGSVPGAGAECRP